MTHSRLTALADDLWWVLTVLTRLLHGLVVHLISTIPRAWLLRAERWHVRCYQASGQGEQRNMRWAKQLLAIGAIALVVHGCASKRELANRHWGTIHMAVVLDWPKADVIRRLGPPGHVTGDGKGGEVLIWEIGSKGALLTSRTSRLVPETTTQIHDTSFSSRYMIYYDQGGRAYFWRWEEKGPAGSSLWDLDLYDKHALPVTN